MVTPTYQMLTGLTDPARPSLDGHESHIMATWLVLAPSVSTTASSELYAYDLALAVSFPGARLVFDTAQRYCLNYAEQYGMGISRARNISYIQ